MMTQLRPHCPACHAGDDDCNATAGGDGDTNGDTGDDSGVPIALQPQANSGKRRKQEMSAEVRFKKGGLLQQSCDGVNESASARHEQSENLG